MDFKNQRGSVMVEAAILFPVVILAVVGIICILIFFYNQIETQSSMHMAMRKEAGEINKTTEYLTKVESPYPVYRKGKYVYSKGTLTFLERGLLRGNSKELQGRYYVTRGKDIVRHKDLFLGQGGKSET